MRELPSHSHVRPHGQAIETAHAPGHVGKISLCAYALYSPKLGGRALALRAMVGLTGPDPEQRTAWMHVAMVGEWLGHPDGPFKLGVEDFKSVVAEFESKQNPTKLDYEHGSLIDDGQPKPSAGFVQKYEIRGDDLWALVEYTPRAAQMIRGGEYRFCSPVFAWDRPDRKSGDPWRCFIHSIALTDTPFLDGQRPIALSHSGVSLTQLTQRVALSSGGPMEINRDALEEALKKLEGDKFTEEQLHALIRGVVEMAKAADPEAGAEVEVDVEEPVDMSALKSDTEKPSEPKNENEKALADMPPPEMPMADAPADPAAVVAELESIASAMGKDVAGLLAYLREMAAGAAGDAAAANPAALKAEVAALKSTMQSYGKQLAKYRERDEADAKAKRDADRRALSDEVDAMVSTGLIVKADAEHWRGLALADATRFRALKSTLRPAVPTGREASALRTQPSESQSMDGSSIDKSDPTVRALYDRYRTHWRITDPAKLDKAVRDHLNRVSAG